MYNFVNRQAEKVYYEKRRELEKALGLVHNVALFKGRHRTKDAAGPVFTYRMGSGYPGDVNRTHPASIEPCLIDAAAPPTAYGQAVVVDPTTQGVRPIVAGDSALTDVYGITVRPFPLQQGTTTPAFGSGVPPVTGVIDVLRSGYIVVVLGNGALTGALKGGTVDVWFAASSGNHVIGNFEATHTGGSSLSLNGTTTFNGVQDANGFVELSLHY